jgi:hypothetical protein
MLITRRNLLRLAAPAIILPEAAWAQFNGCPPGFCSPPAGGSTPTNPCGYPLPTMVTNIIGLWDASCSSTVTTTGTPFNVASIADVTGNGNTMTKYGSTNWPQWSTTAFNGTKGGVGFTSTDLVGLACTNPFPMGTGNTLTVWYTGTTTIGFAEPYSRALSYTNLSSVEQWNVRCDNYDYTTMHFDSNSVSLTSAVVAAASYHRWIFTIKSDGVTTTYVDGVTTTVTNTAGNFTSGGAMHAGSVVGGPLYGYWHGIMGEWGVSSAYTTPTNCAALDSYLSTKWGI